MCCRIKEKLAQKRRCLIHFATCKHRSVHLLELSIKCVPRLFADKTEKSRLEVANVIKMQI